RVVVVVWGVLGRLPAREPAGVRDRRDDADEHEPAGESAAQVNCSSASGIGVHAKFIPAAAAPASSTAPSPMWSVRSGATPSRSSASAKIRGSGFAAPASAGVTTVE